MIFVLAPLCRHSMACVHQIACLTHDLANVFLQNFFNIINGETVSSAVTQHGINPANKEPNPPVPVASPAELDKAVAAAQVAFEQWSPFPLEDRRKALFAYSDALNAEKDGFTSLLTKEQGKPLSQAAMEVENGGGMDQGPGKLGDTRGCAGEFIRAENCPTIHAHWSGRRDRPVEFSSAPGNRKGCFGADYGKQYHCEAVTLYSLYSAEINRVGNPVRPSRGLPGS